VRDEHRLGLVFAVVGVGRRRVAGRRKLTLLRTPMLLPTTRVINPRLVVGSLLFGVGWGLAGFCPGPALVALGTGQFKALVFVAAMLAGMLLYEWVEHLRVSSAASGERAVAGKTE
jgi:uncharacterized membrane protein YedE/YeeE